MKFINAKYKRINFLNDIRFYHTQIFFYVNLIPELLQIIVNGEVFKFFYHKIKQAKLNNGIIKKGVKKFLFFFKKKAKRNFFYIKKLNTLFKRYFIERGKKIIKCP
jgi:hypothetical protein